MLGLANTTTYNYSFVYRNYYVFVGFIEGEEIYWKVKG